MAINLALSVGDLLDKAKAVHRLPSDYKLSLVMGVSHSALVNYRAGKTLPDTRVIKLICDLTGDDPALFAVQIEEQRAKTDDARALWHEIAQRLQAAGTTAVFAVAFLVAGMVGFPSDAKAAGSSFSQLTNLYIVEGWKGVFARLLRALMAPAVRYLQRLFQGGYRVPGTASIAHA